MQGPLIPPWQPPTPPDLPSSWTTSPPMKKGQDVIDVKDITNKDGKITIFAKNGEIYTYDKEEHSFTFQSDESSKSELMNYDTMREFIDTAKNQVHRVTSEEVQEMNKYYYKEWEKNLFPPIRSPIDPFDPKPPYA